LNPTSEQTPEATEQATEEADTTDEAETEADATEMVTMTPMATPTESPFPTPEVGNLYVAEQEFQNGRMFWVRPINQIWVLRENDDGANIWEVYEDTWEEGMPEEDPTLEPPATGLIQPIRGFGLLWRENDDLREDLGWAIEEEVGYIADYEYHYGGTVEDDTYEPGPGYHLVENLAGRIFRFNEGIWTWEVIETEEN
jgi:hypothetical protein